MRIVMILAIYFSAFNFFVIKAYKVHPRGDFYIENKTEHK